MSDEAKITVYGAEWCSACKDAKAFILSTNPQAHGVAFEYVDVGENPAQYGVKTLPTIGVGSEYQAGFSKERLSASIQALYDSLAEQPPPDDLPDPPIDTAPSGGGITLAVFCVLGFLAAVTLVEAD